MRHWGGCQTPDPLLRAWVGMPGVALHVQRKSCTTLPDALANKTQAPSPHLPPPPNTTQTHVHINLHHTHTHKHTWPSPILQPLLRRRVLEDPAENPMVRHEAAEALGAIAEPECIQLLKQVRGAPAGAQPRTNAPASRPRLRHSQEPRPLPSGAGAGAPTCAAPPCAACLAPAVAPHPWPCAPPLSLRASRSLQYATDPEPIVADSCIVALDMLEFEQSGGFQYADDGSQPATAPAVVTASA